MATKAAKEEAQKGASAEAGVLETFAQLQDAIAETKLACRRGMDVIATTLIALDRIVYDLNPVSVDGRFIPYFIWRDLA